MKKPKVYEQNPLLFRLELCILSCCWN